MLIHYIHVSTWIVKMQSNNNNKLVETFAKPAIAGALAATGVIVIFGKSINMPIGVFGMSIPAPVVAFAGTMVADLIGEVGHNYLLPMISKNECWSTIEAAALYYNQQGCGRHH